MLPCHIRKTAACLGEEKDKEMIRVRVVGGEKDNKIEDEKGEAIDTADTCEETYKGLNFKSSFGSEAHGFHIIRSHDVARKISGNFSYTRPVF